jgi:hypothetical protein
MGLWRSRRILCQIRRAVCRCFFGARSSATKIPSMKSITGPRLGRLLTARFRSGGVALAKACRTIRRRTPSFRYTPWIVPVPCVYSRLISSNSSTFVLLSIGLPVGSADRVPNQ